MKLKRIANVTDCDFDAGKKSMSGKDNTEIRKQIGKELRIQTENINYEPVKEVTVHEEEGVAYFEIDDMVWMARDGAIQKKFEKRD